MQGMIGDFLFKMDKAGINTIKQKFNFGWSKKERLYNHPIYQKKNRHSHAVEISGVLVVKKIYALDELVNLAKEKKPVTLTLGAISEVLQVVILSIDIDRDILLDTGEEMRKKFVMRVEQFYGNSN